MASPDATLAAGFHAPADPIRCTILRRLGQVPASVGILARPFRMALPLVLKHLHKLEEGGLAASLA